MMNNLTNCLDRPTDKLDPRQYILATIQGEEDSTPVEFMDLMKNMSAVIRQNFGSCTAQGTDAIKEFQEQKLLSQYFIYVMSKKISGIYDQEGEYLINPLKAVCKYGVPEEKFMPDVKPPSGKWIDYVKKEPSKEAYENALKHLGKTYWRVNMGATNFRNAIYKNRTPTIFAMKWYDSYNRCPQSGILPSPDRLVGYHAVCGVGWDKDGLWVKNSFGEQWGHNGYFKILFDKWDVVQPYACYVLLDLKTNNNKMILAKQHGHICLIDEAGKFGWSIPEPKHQIDVTKHFKKCGIDLGEPIKKDLTGYYLVRGATAFDIKEFFNI